MDALDWLFVCIGIGAMGAIGVEVKKRCRKNF